MSLDVSNTKMSDKNAIELFEVVVRSSQITTLNLARNASIGFKFSAQAIMTLKSTKVFKLQYLDISYCGVSS